MQWQTMHWLHSSSFMQLSGAVFGWPGRADTYCNLTVAVVLATCILHRFPCIGKCQQMLLQLFTLLMGLNQ
jgi:hypothetical protein